MNKFRDLMQDLYINQILIKIVGDNSLMIFMGVCIIHISIQITCTNRQCLHHIYFIDKEIHIIKMLMSLT